MNNYSNQLPQLPLSTHNGTWDGEYNHQRYVQREIRLIHGVVEMARRGMNSHFTHFPHDKVNGRYLAKFVRPLYQLENAVDSWDQWLLRITTKQAWEELGKLREKALDLITSLGPAAEAFRLSRTTAWSLQKTVTPWRRVSATRMKKLVSKLRKARTQLAEVLDQLAEVDDEVTAQKSNVLHLQQLLHEFADRLSSTEQSFSEAQERFQEDRYLYQERLHSANRATMRTQEQLEVTREGARQLQEQLEAQEITILALMMDNLHL